VERRFNASGMSPEAVEQITGDFDVNMNLISLLADEFIFIVFA
jgi:hypothetical protein